MRPCEKFICLEYSNLDIIISQKVAFSASFCNPSEFIKDKNGDDKTFFNSKWIPFIDVDKYVPQSDKNRDNDNIGVKTCIVAHNKFLYENEPFFGLVTATDCKVKEFDFASFSIFSDLYNKFLEKKGIIACKFDAETNSKIGYLVDIEKFLLATLQNAGVKK